MGMFLMTPTGEQKVPAGGGVANIELLTRLDVIENEIQILKKKATENEYGLAKISEASDVTESDNGLVLGAKEKNANIDGSIAYNIEKVKENGIVKTFAPNLLVPQEKFTILNCSAIGNVVLIRFNISAGYIFYNTQAVMQVPESFRPAQNTNWIPSGYAYLKDGVTVEKQFYISARASSNGNILIANDWGIEMDCPNISLIYMI